MTEYHKIKLHTRDVQYVTSAVLPFVNYMSHVVKTCIRSNFKPYLIIMHKIVLTLSSMWLFDVVKNMSSTVPEKMDPKAEPFPFYVFTQTKLGHDRFNIHADLIHAHGAHCVSHCNVCRWTEGFRAEKVSFENGHRLGHPVVVRNEQTVLFV